MLAEQPHVCIAVHVQQHVQQPTCAATNKCHCCSLTHGCRTSPTLILQELDIRGCTAPELDVLDMQRWLRRGGRRGVVRSDEHEAALKRLWQQVQQEQQEQQQQEQR